MHIRGKPLQHNIIFELLIELSKSSEIVDVISEYRVYVLQKKIECMCAFAGDPLVYPDAELIKKAVRMINSQPDSPKSYSLDLMVTPRGTAVTEVHNFLSVGLYTVDWDEDLLNAYRDGMNYVTQYNVEQTEFLGY